MVVMILMEKKTQPSQWMPHCRGAVTLQEMEHQAWGHPMRLMPAVTQLLWGLPWHLSIGSSAPRH